MSSMYVEPSDLDRKHLIELLRADWTIDVAAVRYHPVGFGTHHYIAGDWFVNVDDLSSKGPVLSDAFGALERSLRTASALKHAGLEFVHAPVEQPAGGVVSVLSERYAVSVFAHVHGRSTDYGEFATDAERRLVLRALGKMHAASAQIPADLARRDTLAVPLRELLFDALDHLASPWNGGPFSEPARRSLAYNAAAVRERFDHYDELAANVSRDGWVVTHGEPHAGNVIWTGDDSFVLIDWDTVAVGPRERDLWMVEPRDADDWHAYASSGGNPTVDPVTLELYKLWWTLCEIAVYTAEFRSPHTDDANTRLAWKGLQEYLPT